MGTLYTTGPAHFFISFPNISSILVAGSGPTASVPTTTILGSGGVGGAGLARGAKQAKSAIVVNQPTPVQLNGFGLLLTPGPLQYLGTCEVAPYVLLRPAWKPWFNQLGGGIIPMDLIYHGEEGYSFLDLNRFNEVVVAALQARPFSVLGNRGVSLPGDIGTAVLAEGAFIQVYMFFPYVSKTLYNLNLMPPGYRFPASVLFGPDEMKELGIDPRKNLFVFRHLRTFDPSSGIFGCYDHNVGTMPQIN